MSLRVANAAGFYGDNLDAPARLAAAAEVDYLTLEYLAELTMSILARQRAKDPQQGYAGDFLTALASLLPALREQSQLHLVTNAGGVNPQACARQAARLAQQAGLDQLPIAMVAGDDLLSRLPELQAAGVPFAHLDDGRPLSELTAPIVSANAYLGAEGIVAALADDARVVVAGRVADASLTVGPAVKHFHWSWSDYQHLAGASVAGHLIECGAQTTGGFYSFWEETDLADVGYPIATINSDGSCEIGKPAGTGGAVNRATVCEQLVYEIGDPARYFTPDVTVDFTQVAVREVGPDRVAATGARGTPPPDTLKVSLAYEAGFMASAQLLCYGRNCVRKARECARLILARLRQAGVDPQRYHFELLGAGDGVPGVVCSEKGDPPEVVLRVAMHDARRAAVERFTREIAPLATAGPAGLAGYAAGKAQVRPVYAYWPTLIPRELAVPIVEVRTAREWGHE